MKISVVGVTVSVEFVKLVEDIYLLREKIQNEDNKKIVDEIQNISIHNVKFLTDIFLYISRSSLSLNAKAFEEFLKQKFEYEYKSQVPLTPQQKENKEFKINLFKR